MEKIDFVIAWVDGNDFEWQAEKKKWEPLSKGTMDPVANGGCRYRADDVSLRFCLRSIEKYAPWVSRIHFVTCGQKPY